MSGETKPSAICFRPMLAADKSLPIARASRTRILLRNAFIFGAGLYGSALPRQCFRVVLPFCPGANRGRTLIQLLHDVEPPRSRKRIGNAGSRVRGYEIRAELRPCRSGNLVFVQNAVGTTRS